MRNSSGQVIIEAVIALSALLVLLAAIAVVITTSLSNTTFSNNQDLANKHAQEGMEVIRTLTQSNRTITVGGSETTVFSLSGPYFCMGDDGEISLSSSRRGTPRDGCGVNVDNSFVRTVAFSQNTCSGAEFEGVEVRVEAAWSSGSCACDDPQRCSISDRYCHSATLVSCFLRPEPNSQL